MSGLPRRDATWQRRLLTVLEVSPADINGIENNRRETHRFQEPDRPTEGAVPGDSRNSPPLSRSRLRERERYVDRAKVPLEHFKLNKKTTEEKGTEDGESGQQPGHLISACSVDRHRHRTELQTVGSVL